MELHVLVYCVVLYNITSLVFGDLCPNPGFSDFFTSLWVRQVLCQLIYLLLQIRSIAF